MNSRHHALATLGITALLLTGCAAAATPGADTTAPATPTTASTPREGHAGGHDHSTPAPAATTTNGPSEAALMVCSDQPKKRLTSILKLETAPHTISDWTNNTFTCTYHLQEGALKISVKETTDQTSARESFDVEQATARNAKPVEGLANLGFPAYETPNGSAVFQKDNFVLHVDASDLPATLGPDSITRNALAYQLSTTILACWVEHH